MAQYNNNWGVGIIGGGCLEKLKIVVFLGKHVSLIYSFYFFYIPIKTYNICYKLHYTTYRNTLQYKLHYTTFGNDSTILL